MNHPDIACFRCTWSKGIIFNHIDLLMEMYMNVCSNIKITIALSSDDRLLMIPPFSELTNIAVQCRQIETTALD
jgi:hypothetical protein